MVIRTIIFLSLFVQNFFIFQEIKVQNLSSSAFKKQISFKHSNVIDVRTKGEYRAEHIADAGQLNFYATNFKRKLLLLPKDKPIYLYCNTGYRSLKAANFLLTNGYKKVYNLEHGIMEWNLLNFPVVKGDYSLINKKNLLTMANYQSILKKDSLILVDFYATWCGPCRQLMPLIDSLGKKYINKITILKANADVSKQLIKQLKVKSVPYIQLYKNQKLVYQHYGMLTKDTINKLIISNL